MTVHMLRDDGRCAGPLASASNPFHNLCAVNHLCFEVRLEEELLFTSVLAALRPLEPSSLILQRSSNLPLLSKL